MEAVVAGPDRSEAVVSTVPDAAELHAAQAHVGRPPVKMHALFLTDRSGDGDLRDL